MSAMTVRVARWLPCVLLLVLVPVRVEAESIPDQTHFVPMDSALAARLAALLSGWLARTTEGRTGLAFSDFRRMAEYNAAIEPVPWGANESSADSVQLSLRQRFGYIRYSPDSSRYVDLNLYGEIEVVNGDTQFLSRTPTRPSSSWSLVAGPQPGSSPGARVAAQRRPPGLTTQHWRSPVAWKSSSSRHVVRSLVVNVLRLNSGQRTIYVWRAGDGK